MAGCPKCIFDCIDFVGLIQQRSSEAISSYCFAIPGPTYPDCYSYLISKMNRHNQRIPNVMTVNSLLNHEPPTPRHRHHHTVGPVAPYTSQNVARISSNTARSQQTTPPGRARRDNRPDYTSEEEDFIWYNRIDLHSSW